MDIGSSFLPSEVTAAFLWAQLEHLDDIQQRRRQLWEEYDQGLREWLQEFGIHPPFIPGFATNNGQMYYLVCGSLSQRQNLMNYLREHDIQTAFHYLSLHKSPFYEVRHDGRELPRADHYADCLLRLPMFYELDALETIVSLIRKF
jgi:dTDP-4-amino-4,6-dideoxygalactose transaminase